MYHNRVVKVGDNMNEPEKLIYDRSLEDVARAKTLLETMGNGTATEEERVEWFTGRIKGAWNYIDLNRIEAWTLYLRDMLLQYGYYANVVPLNISRATGDLPTGYTKLEYIQSSGTQYINTDFKPNQNTRIVFDFDPITVVEEWYFGTRTSSSASDRFSCLIAGNTMKLRTDYAGTNKETSFVPSGRTVIDKNKNVTKFGSSSVSATSATFLSAYPLYLFAGDTGGTANGQATLRLYSCVIYDNGTVVRDFVPCKNPSGVVGLYDKVGKKFYGNSGTGTFMAGRIVSTDVEQLEPDRWYEMDIPKKSDIDRIRNNVDALQNGFLSVPEWRKIIYNTTIDYGQANTLEWDMQTIYKWLAVVVDGFKLKQANSIIMIAGGALNQ